MSSKSLGLFALGIFALVLIAGLASAVTLAQWPLNADGLATSVPVGVSAGTFVNSVAVTNFGFGAINGAHGENWPIGASPLDTTKYFEVTISPQSGNNLVISDINFDYMASIAGPASFELKQSKLVGFGSPTFVTTKTDVDTTQKTSLNSSLNIQINSGETLTLRWFGYNFNAVTNEFRVENLLISGTVTPISTSLPPEVSSCSSIGNPGQLRVKGIDFNNRGMQYNTFGEDDEWFPFEEIEAEIKVENNGNDDVDDISVEWGIWDTDKNQWVIDLDEEDEINLKDGDDDTLTLTFKIDDDMDVDLDELTDGNNYRFYVVATGTVDNSTLSDPDTCASDFEQTSIIIESDFVVLDNFEVPETVQCGETATVTADAWNIGDNDQDSVSVFVENSELGISEDIDLGDIDAFDSQKVALTFAVPGDAEEKTYRLNFQVYDEDSDIYENDFDDDKSEFMIPLQVSGNCGGTAGEGKVSVSADIASGGKAGQEMVVRATITNTGSTRQTYVLNVAGSEDWASSFSLDKNSLTLDAGQSEDVLVTLDTNDDSAGSRTFFLEFVSGGELIRQPVTVTISGRGAGITGFITADNWYLWGIGLLNIILVIIIILVAVRIAKK